MTLLAMPVHLILKEERPPKFDFAWQRKLQMGGATSGVNYINSDYRIVDIDLEDPDLVRHLKWDSDRYVNVWLVDQIEGEALALYEGRTWWTRVGIGGYASGNGIVMAGLSTALLAHEVGHYFGLLHTWEGMDCRNNDCLVDGDMVCDTPPDRSVFNSCGDNSCSTDTLSNFSNNTFMSDTLDMGTNFMDYGNDGCSLDFSLGQAEKMQFNIDTSFPNLPIENRTSSNCDSPCENFADLQIEMGVVYPVVGESITFSSVADGEVTNYEWYIQTIINEWVDPPNGDPVSSVSEFDHIFTEEGRYSIYLRAWDATDSTCFASVSRNFRVTCGVNARFSPDKREIASKQPHALMTDSVTFTNRSFGANSYEWKISHENHETEGTDLADTLLNDTELTYYFREPGLYSISLTASNGTCEHTSGTFQLPVHDPTIDGAPFITNIFCERTDQVGVDFTVFNGGYDTIRANTPIIFYDANPVTDGGANILGKMNLPRIIYGFESESFSTTLQHDLATLDEVFIVFNDTGQVNLPLFFPPADANLLSTETIFPNTGLSELTYNNNVSGYELNDETSFEEAIVLCVGDTVDLNFNDLVETPICWDSIIWNSDSQGDLGLGEFITYTTLADDLINFTLVSNDGVRVSGSVNALTSTPQFSVDSVFRIIKGAGVRISLQGQAGYTYQWFPEAGLDDPTSGDPFVSPEENTLYTVIVTDEFGCTEEQQIQVWVETTAYIPNLFTPNGDRANDRLLIYDLFGVRNIEFQVVNKEGVQVFASTQTNELNIIGWDGSKNGRPQPSGVYFWTVKGTYDDGRNVLLNGEQSGIVHLVR